MNVLLSHINEEAQVASVLKEWIESSLDRDVEISGETQDIQLGKQRLAEVDRVLSAAQVVLLLCSERSISRPWINFESGCAWFKRVPVMAVCHDGCFTGDLPPPLGSFPAFDLTDAASCQALLETLAKYLKRKRVPRVDCGQMVAELKAALDPNYVPTPPATRPNAVPEPLTKPSNAAPKPPAKRANDFSQPIAKRRRAAPAPTPAPAPPDPDPPSPPIELRLLATIKRLPDFTCNAPDLAVRLEEQERTVRHALEKLVNNHLLTLKASTHPTDPETRYAIADRGRMYLAKHAA